MTGKIKDLLRLYNGKSKHPKDVKQLAKSIVDSATTKVEDTATLDHIINATAAALWRKGGLVGGEQEPKYYLLKGVL